jgi:uncharacterized membrane protein YphA (DoxX/SURF4 family)
VPTESKPRKIAYWVFTSLTALAYTASGSMNLMGPPELIAGLEKLGMPLYLPLLLGVAKLLAVVAILAPGFARLKEWAYAGITFAMVGACYSHIMSGDPINDCIAPLIPLSFALASYFLRPADRRLPDLAK